MHGPGKGPAPPIGSRRGAGGVTAVAVSASSLCLAVRQGIIDCCLGTALVASVNVASAQGVERLRVSQVSGVSHAIQEEEVA